MVHEHAAQRAAPESYLANKGSILDELDRSLGYSAPPAVEFIFVENVLPDFGSSWIGLGFGHAALRYTLPSGEQRLVNITRGGAGGVETSTPLVQFFEDPADYLFGTEGQGGIFSRSICLVRVQHWDPDSVLAMDHWLRGVAHAFQRENEHALARVSFNHCGALMDALRLIFGLEEQGITGNCSNWTSNALLLGGLTKRQHSFPKAIVADMVDHLILDRERNQGRQGGVHVAYLDRAGGLRRPVPSKLRRRAWHSMVAPFYFLKTWLYWDLRRFADVVVCVEREQAAGEEGNASGARVRAVISKGDAWRPAWSRTNVLVRMFHSIAVAALCVAFVVDPAHVWLIPCTLTAYIARLFFVLVFLLLNALWN